MKGGFRVTFARAWLIRTQREQVAASAAFEGGRGETERISKSNEQTDGGYEIGA
jgi:hypothetical protein